MVEVDSGHYIRFRRNATLEPGPVGRRRRIRPLFPASSAVVGHVVEREAHPLGLLEARAMAAEPRRNTREDARVIRQHLTAPLRSHGQAQCTGQRRPHPRRPQLHHGPEREPDAEQPFTVLSIPRGLDLGAKRPSCRPRVMGFFEGREHHIGATRKKNPRPLFRVNVRQCMQPPHPVGEGLGRFVGPRGPTKGDCEERLSS